MSERQRAISFELNLPKKRLQLMMEYDFRRLPHAVASTIEHDLCRFVWTDKENFFYGTGNPDAPIVSEPISFLEEVKEFLPSPFYRDDLTFYPIKARVKHGKVKLEPLSLSHGYLGFFFDVLAGTLGVYKGLGGKELWRRYRGETRQIENIEDSYGVSGTKQIAGVYEIFMDMLDMFPELAPKQVTSGLSINGIVYGGLGEEALTDEMIPKHIIPKGKIDIGKAGDFFEMVCPEGDSRHNLLLATVYPYYKRSNEKFFLMKGIGGSGKSRYMKHFEALLGDKYIAVDLMGLAASGYERSNAIARLQNKLVLHAPDSKMSMADKFVNELKRLATGDKMIGRTIGNNAFSFQPNGVLFIDTNEPVNLGNGTEFLRRRVGIMFVPKKFTEKEFEPYFNWIASVDGASSIFAYAYNYFQDECRGSFSWNTVDVNEGDEFSPELESIADELMSRYGVDEDVSLPASSMKGVPRLERARFLEYYGLTVKAKRFGKRTMKVLAVEDTDVFTSRMRAEGFC